MLYWTWAQTYDQQRMINIVPNRKHPTHGVLYVDGQPTIIFDTVCTKDRKQWLACDEVHDLLREV